MIIVEIKGEPFRSEDVEKAMREVENLNPDKVKYKILETEKESLKFGELEKLKELIYRG